MESSAKENEVMIDISFECQLICAGYMLFLTQIHTLMTIFLQCRLLWRFSSGSFWKWRKLMEMPRKRRRSVLWCKKCIQDISKLICWRQEAQLHQLANHDLTNTKTLQWNFSAPLWYQIDLHSKTTVQTVDKLSH